TRSADVTSVGAKNIRFKVIGWRRSDKAEPCCYIGRLSWPGRLLLQMGSRQHHSATFNMSVDMNSQGSDSNEDYDPNCDDDDEEEEDDPGDIEDYYDGVANDVEQQGADSFDPEEYLFSCLTYRESESALNEQMANMASLLKVSHSVAKLILVNFHWQVSEILE
ncbi:E3 ubiquitin- ligase ARIH2 isoform X1, partial [Pelobates cultripes]